MPSSGSRPGTLRSSSATARGTFSMAADTRGQFHEWSKEQYVVRNSRCPLKLLPNNAPTLTRELSALSTSQTSRNEKVPHMFGVARRKSLRRKGRIFDYWQSGDFLGRGGQARTVSQVDIR